MTSLRARSFSLIAVLLLAVSMLIPAISQAAAQAQTACTGYYYVVQRGDTWNTVSQATGVTVTELIRANPQALRWNSWLWIGDRLCIPARSSAPAQPASGGYWYQVKPGDTWNTVSTATGVPVRELWRVNPGLVNARYWLYIGQRVWIPAAPPDGTDGAAQTEATPEPPTPPAPAVVEPTPTVVATATATPTPTAVATATPTPTAVATATPTPTATLVVAARPTTASGCPGILADYPAAILAHLNTARNTVATLTAWLTKCQASGEGRGDVVTANIQSARSTDVVITLRDPLGDPISAKGMLLIYHTSQQGYTLARQAEGTGAVALLQASDLNGDKKVDVVWTDTSCGAHTCFSTLFVDTWDGAAYQDWLAGEPTIASAEFSFKDVTPDGSGQEIIMHGGVIGSVGAGPQRGWTETYASLKDAPYTLFKQVYDASTCLYHQILDANQALDNWTKQGFDPAIAAYKTAIGDKAAEACGTIPDELVTLRDFARFRLIVAYVGGGEAAEAEKLAPQITQPGLRGAAEIFLKSYKSTRSVLQACRDTTAYAQTTPGAWEFLADWGYANPSFKAEDLCPLN